MGRSVLFLGIIIVGIGLLLLALGKLGIPLGHLPGDLAYRGRSFGIFAPLGTCLLLSALLSLALYVFHRLHR